MASSTNFIPLNTRDLGAILTQTNATAGANSTDQTNYNTPGLHIVLNVTTITGTTPTVAIQLQGKDTASGQYYNIGAASATLNAAGTIALQVYPGLTTGSNIVNGALPRTWRVQTVTTGTVTALTCTVGASLIV